MSGTKIIVIIIAAAVAAVVSVLVARMLGLGDSAVTIAGGVGGAVGAVAASRIGTNKRRAEV